MANLYNWDLYKAWNQAAIELDLRIESINGSVLHFELPEEVQSEFLFMLWTPLNSFKAIAGHSMWQTELNGLRQLENDFYIEACRLDERCYQAWFPEINCAVEPITKNDIVKCVRRMLDVDNRGKYDTMAMLRSGSEGR